jgi:uncharacterized membrane protein
LDQEEREGTSISPQRIEAFSDAVFAVAITLLVLSIHLPARKIPENQLLTQLRLLWPNYFAYILSFAIIGMFWLGHHSVFKMLRRHDRGLFWLNLLFLALIVFVPFPTSVLSDYGNTSTATIFYAASLAATGLCMCCIVLYATWQNRLVDDAFDHHLAKHIIYEYLNMSCVFLVSIAIAVASVTFAQYFWILIFVNARILDIIYRRRRPAKAVG